MNTVENVLFFVPALLAKGLLLFAIVGGLFTLIKLQRAGRQDDFIWFTWISIALMVAFVILISTQRWFDLWGYSELPGLLALAVAVGYIWQIARYRQLLDENASESSA